MENSNSKGPPLRQRLPRGEESQVTLAMIFAGIAALFIAGIAAAFIYAKDTSPTQTASAPAPPAASSAPLTAAAPETTGSAAINTTPPKQDPRENEQRERP